jgi:hypothetical protein
MSAASFRFEGELERFLPRARRGFALLHEYARAATLKQAIESLGVPHTEVGRLIVNGEGATLARTVRENDSVVAFPHEPGRGPFEAPLSFIADAHMGGLARLLRMLGFDTIYDNTLQDAAIVERSKRKARGTDPRSRAAQVQRRSARLLRARAQTRGSASGSRTALPYSSAHAPFQTVPALQSAARACGYARRLRAGAGAYPIAVRPLHALPRL